MKLIKIVLVITFPIWIIPFVIFTIACETVEAIFDPYCH